MGTRNSGRIWGGYVSAGALPNVAGAETTELKAHDLAVVIGTGWYECTDPTGGAAVWVPLGGGGGSGNDSYPDIDLWVTVDTTTGSYSADGTIQFPENTVAQGIVAAQAMTPGPTRKVGIKLMPGRYIESNLDLPQYVYVVGESREACVIAAAAPSQLLTQTNSDCGWFNVSFERSGNDDTATYAIEIGADDGLGAGAGVLDVVFESVNFDFDQNYGIIVQGATSPSGVVFRKCRMQADYDPLWLSRTFGQCLTVYSSGAQEHSVEFEQGYIDGEVWPQIGTFSLRDVWVNGQLYVTDDTHSATTTNIRISHSRVEFFDVDQPSRFGAPEGGLHVYTTGEVFLDQSVFLGTNYDDGCMFTTNNSVYFMSPDDTPSRLVMANCRFGSYDLGASYSLLGRTIDVGFGIASYMTAVISQCTFDAGVSSSLVNEGQVEFPCGTGQLYSTASVAMSAAAKVGTDYLIVKLHDDDPCSVSSSWPDGQWIILDLNGFTATGGGTIISETFGSGFPYAIIRNGRMAGGWTLINASGGTTGNWQVIYRNIDIDDGAQAAIFGGGSSCKIIFDNVRNWIGLSSYCMRLAGSNNPEIQFRHCYLKGTAAEAVQFDNSAFTKFYASRSTFFHGSFGANLPLVSNNSISQGSATPVLDYCRFNADPSTDPFITLAAESAYNINNATADFLG